MQKLIYNLVWEYREAWNVARPVGGLESVQFSYVEGTTEGRLTGRFRGTNHSRRRSDGNYLPNAQGIIETPEGVEVIVDYQGYGFGSHPSEDPLRLRKVLLAAHHFTEHPDWEFLNDTVSIGIGENRITEEGTLLLMINFYETVWQPLDEKATLRPELPDPVFIEPKVFNF